MDLLKKAECRGPLSCDTVLKIFFQTCRAVLHMHRQKPPITHRDLKVSPPACSQPLPELPPQALVGRLVPAVLLGLFPNLLAGLGALVPGFQLRVGVGNQGANSSVGTARDQVVPDARWALLRTRQCPMPGGHC